jgi:phage portal protein BeeE
MRVLDALLPKRMNIAEAYFNAGDGFGGMTTFSVGGQTYTVPVQTTMPGQKTESIANSFEGFVAGGLAGNSVIFGLASVRLRVFSEARFQFQKLQGGRPGDLFGNPDLAILENPWPGGTTGDLLAAMILHADFAGNCYVAKINGQLVLMRPDWVQIILGDRSYRGGTVGLEKLGYNYYQGGINQGADPVSFLAEEVAHFSPQPDPLAWYRGMSWMTPVIREIRADSAMIGHKLKFFENAATPNLAVKLQETDPEKFAEFVDKMDAQHAGWQNAYKTLYTGAGADVTVIGKDMRELDFAVTQGKGETRLAQAAGVPAVVAGLSEGLQGSSLNSGNFTAARRQFADMTLSPLWRNAAGSLEVIVPAPSGTRLWYDTRDIPFLREDQQAQATIQESESRAVRELFMAGFEPDSIIAAVTGNDLTLLKHTGTYSIQVQTPGTTSTKLPSTVDEPPAGPESSLPSAPQKPAIAPQPALPAPQAGAGKRPGGH